jgi:hypothetical protein
MFLLGVFVCMLNLLHRPRGLRRSFGAISMHFGFHG